MKEQYMEMARQIAAQCWCDEETKHTVMDGVLAESVARRIAAWMEEAAQAYDGLTFYRDLVDECAKYLGPEVFISDDGSIQDSPIRLKVPELVAKLAGVTYVD